MGGRVARVPGSHMSLGDSLGTGSMRSDAVHTCGRSGRDLCSQMAMHSAFGVCSAANTTTTSTTAAPVTNTTKAATTRAGGWVTSVPRSHTSIGDYTEHA